MKDLRRLSTLKPHVPTTTVSGSSRRGLIDVGRFHQYRGVILLIFAALVIWLNLAFIKPIVMGAIFAVVLYPLMRKMDRWRVGKVWKASLVTFGFAVMFLIPIAILVILGADAALEKVRALENFDLSTLTKMSPSRVIDYLGLRPYVNRLSSISPVSEGQLLQMAGRALTTGGAILGRALQELLGNLPGMIFSNIIILFTIFFLLVDGPRAVSFIRQNSIFGRYSTEKILTAVGQLCQSVIVATIVSGAVQSTMIGIGCLITGVHGVALIVLVSFIASFFPVVGTAPVTIFLTLQAFIAGDTTSGIIWLVFIGLVGVSDNIVRPYVLKGGAELHPLVGFVAAFGALEAIGFYGLFIGPVVAGLFFTLLPMVTQSYSAPKGCP